MGFLGGIFGSQKLNVQKRFELLREAISGTMSKVYMAKDRETGEIVALKLLDPKKTAAFEARFKGIKKPTEGEIAIQFDHPHIVKTLEQGLTTKREQYLVMEFLEGAGLNSVLLAKEDLMAGARVLYMRQVAEALAAVHQAGFIHRDICPRNLIFAGDASSLKLTDFGLTVPATPPFMAPGNRTGTPNYMAPELVHRQPTNLQLDVFSFGVTIYEMCTAELPWQRGTTGMAAMTHDTEPVDIHTYRPQIHPRLARAIHACIEPKLEKRCKSMQDFLQILGPIQSEDE